MVVLMLLTTTFAAVWSGDQQTQQRFIVARKAAAQRERSIQLANATHDLTMTANVIDQSQSASSQVDSSQAPQLQSQHSYVAHVEIEMSLPDGIAAGRYRVVDQSGQVQTIRIADRGLPASPRDLYVLNQSDGRQRYFIRISADGRESHEPRTAHAPEHSRR